MVADLMETCIDDVIRTPVVPTVIATEEAGPSNTYASASVIAEDPLSLTGEAKESLSQIGISVAMNITQIITKKKLDFRSHSSK